MTDSSRRSSTILATVPRPRRVTFWVPVIVAGVVPLVLAFFALRDPAYPIAPDTPSYAVPGANFWHGRGYGATDARGEFVPEMARTPLYPLLIGPFYSDAPRWYWPVLLLQALLRAAIVLLLLCLPGRDRSHARLFGGWIAGWIVALDFTGALLAVRVLTETFSAFLLLLSVWFLLQWRESEKSGWLLGAGLLSGLNVLCRPINIVAAVVVWGVVCVVLWKGWRTGGGRTFWRNAILFTGLLLVLPAAWMGRNAAYAGRPILTLTTSVNLYFYRAAYIRAHLSGRNFYTVQGEMREASRKEFESSGLRPWEIAGIEEGRARKIIAAHPAIYLHGMASGFVRELIGPGSETWKDYFRAVGWTRSGGATLSTSDGAASRNGVKAAAWVRLVLGWALLLLGFVYAGISMGLLRAVRHRRLPFPVLLSLLLVLVLLLAAAGPEAYSRFRVPLMPLLALASGMGWVWRNWGDHAGESLKSYM